MTHGIRERVDEDRRGAVGVLTPDGARALRRAWPRYAGGINRLLLAPLTQDEATTIRIALERVAQEAAGAADSGGAAGCG
jgi:DNA-binding MarR family transcriptional regulator